MVNLKFTIPTPKRFKMGLGIRTSANKMKVFTQGWELLHIVDYTTEKAISNQFPFFK